MSPPSNVIDVELYAREQEVKYGYDPESVVPINAEEFRQGVRQSKGKEKNEERAGQRSTSSTLTTPQARVGSTGARIQQHSERINYASAIAPAIHDLRMKRSLSKAPPISAPATPLKRRRFEQQYPTPMSSTAHLSSHAASQTPIPGSSKDVSEPRTSLKRSSDSTTSDNIASKRQRTHVAAPSRPPKRSIVIELFSDGEEVLTAHPIKKPKIQKPAPPIIEISDSDSEAITFDFPDPLPGPLPEPFPSFESESTDESDGSDLNDSDQWKPMEINRNKLEKVQDVPDDLNQIAQLWKPPPRKTHPDTSRLYPQRNPLSSRGPEFIWNQVSHQIHKPRPPICAFAWKSPLGNKKPRWPLDFGLSELKCSRSFKKSPGSINRIEQKGPWTVIASGSIGGLPDEPDEEANPYNRKGSLITYNDNGMLDIPTGHQGSKHGITKHYAVHDVKFDPTRLSFVSTGADRRLRIWTPPDEDEAEADPNSVDGELIIPSWSSFLLETLNRVPHDLAFKPSSSILAVGEKKLQIYSLSANTYEHTRSYNHHSHKDHIVGSLVWGVRPTSQHLFASSEPIDHGVFEGVHSVYDVDHGTQIYNFDASEAGDTMSLSSDGMTLALSTLGPERSHILRLYDVARQHKSATTTITLDSFPGNCEGEVTNAMFSPDGVYLSLARNDNHIHVYDVRYLTKGVIFDYAHSTESKAASQTLVYGVVKAQWIQSELTSRIGLVSAGEDGCVRFWDPTKAAPDPRRVIKDISDSQNGRIVAEVNSDIGHFSLGDRMEGEHRLVVGDCAGEVSFFSDIAI